MSAAAIARADVAAWVRRELIALMLEQVCFPAQTQVILCSFLQVFSCSKQDSCPYSSAASCS